MTYLTVPPICKEAQVDAVEDDIEGKPSWGEKLPLKPSFTHNDD